MESARRLGNCLTVALTLWWATRGRGWMAVRRSEGLYGLVPHFGHGRVQKQGQQFLFIEAIPPRRKGVLWDRGDSFVLFPMIYRATRYKRVAMGTGDTLRDAVRQMWARDVCKHCGRMP